jgi:hypothetical protein
LKSRSGAVFVEVLESERLAGTPATLMPSEARDKEWPDLKCSFKLPRKAPVAAAVAGISARPENKSGNHGFGSSRFVRAQMKPVPENAYPTLRRSAANGTCWPSIYGGISPSARWRQKKCLRSRPRLVRFAIRDLTARVPVKSLAENIGNPWTWLPRNRKTRRHLRAAIN